MSLVISELKYAGSPVLKIASVAGWMVLSVAALQFGSSSGARAAQPRVPFVQPAPLAFKVTIQQPPYTGALGPESRSPAAVRASDLKRHATQSAIATRNVELRIYGPCRDEKTGVEVWGAAGSSVPLNLWTGMCRSPVAVTFRDTRFYVDLTGPARIRWLTRSDDLHAVRPVLRLADGTLLVGSYAYRSPPQPQEPNLAESEFYLGPIRWYRLNPRTIATMGPVSNPDLSKVDAVGFADLMPGGGHGKAGWINLSQLEVFGKKVPR